MNDITVLIPCYKSPELLNVSVNSLIESITMNVQIIVILNEADQKSKDLLNSINIPHIDLEKAYGPAAVDYAIPYIDSKYVLIAQSDHIFYIGWDKILVDLINYRSDIMFACCGIVEPFKNNPIIHYDRLGDFINPITKKNFYINCAANKYNNNKYYISDMQPSLCRTEDFKKINGYSNNFRKEWFNITACRGLDIDYVRRMWLLYDKKGYSIATNKTVVYHGVSKNQNKYPKSGNGKQIFKDVTGTTINEFYEEFKLYSPVKLKEL